MKSLISYGFIIDGASVFLTEDDRTGIILHLHDNIKALSPFFPFYELMCCQHLPVCMMYVLSLADCTILVAFKCCCFSSGLNCGECQQ
jgi:hypothetical protein